MKIYKELSELGFFQWSSNQYGVLYTKYEDYMDMLPLDNLVITQLNAIAFKWFREVHKLNGWVSSRTIEPNLNLFIPHCREIPDVFKRNLIVDLIPYVSCKSHEDAEIELLKFLIEKVKNDD